MIATFLFEHNDLLREGLKSYLSGTCFDVVGERKHIGEFCASDRAPDLVITGMNPDFRAKSPPEFRHGLDAFRGLYPATRMVLLTSVEEVRLTPEILDYDVDGYILRDISREAIVSYLSLAMLGEKAWPRPIAMLLCPLSPCLDAGAVAPNDAQALSERENAVVQCLALGESNKAIARHLDITESTVKGHIKIILRKLRVQNRTQAALVASKNVHDTSPTAGMMAA